MWYAAQNIAQTSFFTRHFSPGQVGWMRPNLRTVLHSRICRQSFRGHITTCRYCIGFCFVLIFFCPGCKLFLHLLIMIFFCKLIFSLIKYVFISYRRYKIEIDMTGSFHTSILKLRRTRSCEISNGACEIHAFRVTTYLRKSVWLWAAQTVPPAHLRVSDCRSCWTDLLVFFNENVHDDATPTIHEKIRATVRCCRYSYAAVWITNQVQLLCG